MESRKDRKVEIGDEGEETDQQSTQRIEEAIAVSQATEELKKEEGTVVDKTRRFLYALFKIWCAFPTFAYEVFRLFFFLFFLFFASYFFPFVQLQ